MFIFTTCLVSTYFYHNRVASQSVAFQLTLKLCVVYHSAGEKVRGDFVVTSHSTFCGHII